MIADKPTQILQIPQWAKPNIQNIVSTVDLDCTLDLKQIAWKGRNTQYNPNRFAAVVMRLRQPKTTALVFRSGKMVVTGAKSQQQSNTASRKYARIIQKIGFPVKFKKFDIQNIVASCDVKFPINLQQLLHKHRKMARYQPEMFPGLVFKMQNPKIVFLIFVSGKIVLTGAKDRSIINQSFKLIYKIVYDCQKKIVSSDKLNQ